MGRKVLFDQYEKKFQEFNKKMLEDKRVKDNSIVAGQVWELEIPDPENPAQTSTWSWSDWGKFQSNTIVINGFDGYNLEIEFTSDPFGSGGREIRITMKNLTETDEYGIPKYKIFVLKPSYDNLSERFSPEMIDQLMNWYFFYKED